MIFITSREERELVQRLRRLGAVGDELVLREEVVQLKREIADLEIAKSKREEEFARQDRELRHMVGLERQRQQAERKQQEVATAQAAAAAKIEVREENLQAERERFEAQLAFNTERFATMEKYLKDMLSDILARLPNVNVKVRRTE